MVGILIFSAIAAFITLGVGHTLCSSSPKWTQKMIINYLYF